MTLKLTIVAHRGAWSGCPELGVPAVEKNSEAAFRLAVEHHFGIETDFRDICGKVVVSTIRLPPTPYRRRTSSISWNRGRRSWSTSRPTAWLLPWKSCVATLVLLTVDRTPSTCPSLTRWSTKKRTFPSSNV